MPILSLPHRDLDMFYVRTTSVRRDFLSLLPPVVLNSLFLLDSVNPDPHQFSTATHDNLPSSQPFKEGKPTLVFIHAGTSTSFRRSPSSPLLSASEADLYLR